MTQLFSARCAILLSIESAPLLEDEDEAALFTQVKNGASSKMAKII